MANVCWTDPGLRETPAMGYNILGSRQRNVMRAVKPFWVHVWRMELVLRKKWFVRQDIMAFLPNRAIFTGVLAHASRL
jgi:hypothetical protein